MTTNANQPPESPQNADSTEYVSVIMSKEQYSNFLKLQTDLAVTQRLLAESWHSALALGVKRPAEEDLVHVPGFLAALDPHAVPAVTPKHKRNRVKTDLPPEISGYTHFCKQLREEGHVPKDKDVNQASYLGEQWKKVSEEDKKKYKLQAEQKTVEILEQYIEAHPTDAERVHAHIEALKKKWAKNALKQSEHDKEGSSEAEAITPSAPADAPALVEASPVTPLASKPVAAEVKPVEPVAAAELASNAQADGEKKKKKKHKNKENKPVQPIA